MALPIGPLPFTLTDGTLADANQVMANFNTILNGVNALAPLSAAIVGGVSNVAASLPTAGTTITVTADSVTVGTALNGTSYTLTSFSQSFNGSTTGAGGMDTGALPTSGFVALYAIYNPTAPAVSILGKNASVSAPTVYNGANMPAGYTASALLCVLPTNATPAIKPNYVRGKLVGFDQTQVVASAVNVGTPTTVSLTAVVPVNAISCGGVFVLTTGTTPGSANTFITVGPDSNTPSPMQKTYQYNAVNTAGINVATFENLLLPTAQTLFWQTTVLGTSPNAQLLINSYSIP